MFPAKNKKVSFFYIGIKEEDRKIVSEMAKERGMTIADFVCSLLDKEIRKEKERGK